MAEEVHGDIVKRGLWSANSRTLRPRVPHTTTHALADDVPVC